MPNPLHRPAPREHVAHGGARWAAVPGLDRVLTHGARAAFRPERGVQALARSADPAARDLVRHAFADVGGNANLARSWARFAKRWPRGPAARAARPLPAPATSRCCCCGPTRTAATRCRPPRRRSTCCPTRSCASCSGTGFLIAYDDPVGVARELAAFCG